MDKKYVVVELLDNHQTSEQMFVDLYGVHPDFDPDADTDDIDFYVHNRNDVMWYDGDPTPIEELERVLAEMKSRGATHFSAMHHTDHNNFIFTSVCVKVADERQNERINRMEEARREKEERMSQLIEEYTKIKNSIENDY